MPDKVQLSKSSVAHLKDISSRFGPELGPEISHWFSTDFESRVDNAVTINPGTSQPPLRVATGQFALGKTPVTVGVMFYVDRPKNSVVVIHVFIEKIGDSTQPTRKTETGTLQVGSEPWLELTARRGSLLEKKYKKGLTPSETRELQRLQKISLNSLDQQLPLPRLGKAELSVLQNALKRPRRTTHETTSK